MTLPGHRNPAYALAYDTATGLLVSASRNRGIEVWEIRERTVSIACWSCPEEILDVVCSVTGSLCVSSRTCMTRLFVLSSLMRLRSSGMPCLPG